MSNQIDYNSLSLENLEKEKLRIYNEIEDNDTLRDILLAIYKAGPYIILTGTIGSLVAIKDGYYILTAAIPISVLEITVGCYYQIKKINKDITILKNDASGLNELIRNRKNLVEQAIKKYRDEPLLTGYFPLHQIFVGKSSKSLASISTTITDIYGEKRIEDIRFSYPTFYKWMDGIQLDMEELLNSVSTYYDDLKKNQNFLKLFEMAKETKSTFSELDLVIMTYLVTTNFFSTPDDVNKKNAISVFSETLTAFLRNMVTFGTQQSKLVNAIKNDEKMKDQIEYIENKKLTILDKKKAYDKMIEYEFGSSTF